MSTGDFNMIFVMYLYNFVSVISWLGNVCQPIRVRLIPESMLSGKM